MRALKVTSVMPGRAGLHPDTEAIYDQRLRHQTHRRADLRRSADGVRGWRTARGGAQGLAGGARQGCAADAATGDLRLHARPAPACLQRRAIGADPGADLAAPGRR